MIEQYTLQYYLWDDIEQFFCDQLKIKPSQFRDYHEVIGGEHKDLWHVWSTLNCSDIRNDSYITHWEAVLNWDQAEEEYGEWVKSLAPIITQLFESQPKIIVFYSW